SDVLAPAVSVFLICVLCGVTGHPQAWIGLGWGVLLGGFCAVIPMAIIHFAVRRQRLTDRHVTRREQRWWVFLMCAGSVLAGMTATLLLGAPRLLVWILPTMIAGLVLTGTVTLIGPKVSMHAFCLTALVLVAALLISPWCLLAFPALLPLVAFARLRLDHHTPAEIAWGVGLAVIVLLVSRMFVPVVA
ncbi:MAG: hypothetical protein ACRCYX_03305, partial [Dermatophilaceae bacterium]